MGRWVIRGLVLLVAISFAVPGWAHAKPDLVVAGRTAVSPEYFFRGEGTDAVFTGRIKNKGDDKAKASESSLEFVHAPQVPGQVVASTAVGKLKPGKAEFVTGGDALPDLPPGAYDAVVCADYKNKVKEKNESNNCADVSMVYVIVRSWVGSLTGDGPTSLGGSTSEGWSSDDAEFRFAQDIGDGRFSYKFHGTLTYTITGTGSDDCEYSGTDTTALAGDASGQGLILDYRKEEYFGNEGIGGFPFTWMAICDGFFNDDVPGPASVAGGFIVVNPQEIDAHEMPFGSTTLIGTSVSQANGSVTSWLLGAGN